MERRERMCRFLARERSYAAADAGGPYSLGDTQRRMTVARAHALDVCRERRAGGQRANERERELAFDQISKQRLARSLGVANVIKDIVDELERKSHARAELAERACGLDGRARADRAGAPCPFEQRGGLIAYDLKVDLLARVEFRAAA